MGKPRKGTIDKAAARHLLHTLAFAEQMVATVRRRRAELLANGRITLEQHDADVAAAESLLRMAEDKIIFDPFPLN